MKKDEFIEKCDELIRDKMLLTLLKVITIGLPDNFDFTDTYNGLKNKLGD